ncbi:MAG: DegT/DnrJ/EryC1/StrS family aminotransferase [Hyphomicrobiaceae bacterium]|nr:DegT/DnrJ/EryC1/StrS family aminotransferase [Hyphomicrobiaceae bacterium]
MNAPDITLVDLRAQQARIRPAIERAIARVLDHGQYIMGPEIDEFETRLATISGAKHVITCSSGTDALLMAMMAKGVRPGDAVLCPGFTYTATPESIVMLGGVPVFVDVEADTFNIDVSQLDGGLRSARQQGARPIGIIAVDLFGQPANYAALCDFAKREGLWIIADAAQSFGGRLGNRAVGSLTEITATSFFPSKPLGCYGDGGALFTNDDTIAESLRSIRLHGRGVSKYDVARLGINGRLDTLQAAILLEKLVIFADEIVARSEVAARYSAAFGAAGIQPIISRRATSAWAQYTVTLPEARRDHVRQRLRAQGIATEVYYPRALDEQPAFQDCIVVSGGIPIARRLPRTSLSLPMHPYLSVETQDYVIRSLLGAI